ncbi:hypothetical protein DFP73DRAFT_568982 [Morchella snyderi]|nr:hypothetical protein DFP73DRAFT_568982 [Morchella snyderi]
MSSNKDIVWPPQTTEDVLMLTPRKHRPEAPFSPSPLRKNSLPSSFDGANSGDDNDSDDEDEDEEMLKLKLAALEAKLKLKQLQKRRKAAEGGGVGGVADSARKPSSSSSTARNRSGSLVQVPQSPVKSAAVRNADPPMPKSPSRVLLGIDKGLRGADVSLRRPPPYRAVNTRATSPSEQPRKTYSERIAEERAKEKAKAERQKVVEQSRSTGFNFDPISTTFTAGGRGGPDPFVEASRAPTVAPENTEPTETGGFDSFSGLHLSSRLIPHLMLTRHLSPTTIYLLPNLLKEVKGPDFEPPDVEGDWVVLATICSKSEPREVGQNTNSKKGTGKYMVLTLTDLKWEIECFLFGTGFDKFWKLPVGAVVAIMNPGIMKPRVTDTGRFSLTLNDSSDTLLEIGRARDLGFCKAMKRDGKMCGSWVDKRHTHYCAFHIEAGVKKARVGRAEVNSMGKLFSPPKKGTVRPRRFLGGRGGGRDNGLLHEGALADLPQRAGGAGGKVFIAPGRSATRLLDEDYDGMHRGSREERLQKRLAEAEKERQMTRRIIESQGRDGGVGVDYLKLSVDRFDLNSRPSTANSVSSSQNTSVDSLTSLLLRSKGVTAQSVSLSPIKRKRPESQMSRDMSPEKGATKRTRFALPGLESTFRDDPFVRDVDEDDDLIII